MYENEIKWIKLYLINYYNISLILLKQDLSNSPTTFPNQGEYVSKPRSLFRKHSWRVTKILF